MYLLRQAAQVRSLPERLLEWFLLFVSPELFESGLLRFGFYANRYLLWATILVLYAALTVLGMVALARRWSGHTLQAMGIGLWLLIMLVIMPLTGAGIFATELIDGTWAAVLGNLTVCLAYVSSLAVARPGLFIGRRQAEDSRLDGDRRAALVGIVSILAALLGTYLLPLVWLRRPPASVLNPEEPVLSAGVDPPTSHPEAVGSPLDTPTSAEAPETASPPSQTTPEFPEPRPARPLKRDKDGAVLPSGRRKGDLTDLITSNDDFYIVTKNAGGDPIIRASDWRLRIDGEVEQRIELGYAALRTLPAVETTKTLECISNFVTRCELAPFGCDLISTARWRGVRLVDLLALAGGVKSDASYFATVSADEYTTAFPIQVALDPDTLLVYEMNGDVLPREHGYPARLLVPGRYGMKNAKWLIGLRPVRGEFVDWYGQRNWSKDGLVKSMTRIDVPLPGATVPAGDYNIAGIAYSGDRGTSKVEYSADGGETWQQAELIEAPLGRDTWVRWIGRFAVEAGTPRRLVSRATDGAHLQQVEEFILPQPDGSSGWHRIDVQARGT
jgi:DMSO/TMAO reductase YedYZ molybdopterin-dependent catalytic subunit